ncbi:Rho-GTPase-activating protein 5 [Tolypocladium ophioglossoides CBS 100239]|uniref:Rho-GTPase-activating protein 5 n=1 Tax=Tolypocladium ophioglossoides (strain CBS 100239) TaxID=1163406 RepID=A0A0L0NDQ4_TOLOC|nr:Rho-GTPase-activating protein 5 [Tolypocladium ophioglossoides CBS 100239]
MSASISQTLLPRPVARLESIHRSPTTPLTTRRPRTGGSGSRGKAMRCDQQALAVKCSVMSQSSACTLKLPTAAHSHQTKAPGIFGIPLRQSITYANVAISLVDENGRSYIYGYVPIVVAKCGVFLKEKGGWEPAVQTCVPTGIEGIFRLSGSEKRIKELKSIFDSPDRHGKGLVWDSYTVHDAANVLRRYLNDLPEPVVPLDLYERFRDPLRGATKQAVGDADGPHFVDNFDENAAIEKYQQLITELPPLNRQLLLYILDLLAVFAAKSVENRMNPQNLAAIFQPGMLSHPAHAMAPEEYRLNQCVLIFLIQHQDHFLIGMQGTAADEKTKKEVESGTPTDPLTPDPSRTPGGLDRSASNASAGATSVRRDGKVRRNRSVSSRHSRQDGSSTPSSPALAATPTGGLGRSNTVPSKKSPALAGAKFKNRDNSGQQSPAVHVEPMTPVRATRPANQSRSSSPAPAAVGAASLTTGPASVSGPSQERLLLEVPPETPTPPTKERNLQSLFQRSTTDGGEKRQPNKLKKKRIPGSLNISAQSSSASLPRSNTASPSLEPSNPMDSLQPISEPLVQPMSQPTSHPITQPAHATSQPAVQAAAQQPDPLHPQPSTETETQLKPALAQQPGDMSSEPTPRASNIASNSSLHPDDTLRGKKSPPTSVHSSFNEGSDLDQVADEQVVPTAENAEREKKKRWRLSRSRNDNGGGSTSSVVTPPHMNIGSNDKAEISTTSIGSGASKPRKSFTNESSEPTTVASTEGQTAHEGSKDNNRDEPKGPIGWIRNKYREAKENAEQRRNKSPPADRQGISTALLSRGKSLDMKREKRDEEKLAEKLLEKQGEKKATAQKETQEEARKETAQERPIASTAEAPTEAPTAPEETLTETSKDEPEDTAVDAQPQPAAESQPKQALTAVTDAQP